MRALVLMLSTALLVVASCQALAIPDRYDAEIRAASARWLPGWDWRWWKAQLYQESLLDPTAVSPVGARGLAQFMPGTWDEVSAAMGLGAVSPHVAEAAIEAGAYYMARLRRSWHSERPEDDRRELAQASYNAGLGNILKAQRACGNARAWRVIATCLHQITGRHAHETLTYVDRIRRWYQLLTVGG